MIDEQRSKEMRKKWNKAWKETWRPAIYTKGKLDERKIKNEIHDLWFIFEQVGEVYMYITGGLLSKPMYYADAIKTEYDQAIEDAVNEAIKEYKIECANNHHDE